MKKKAPLSPWLVVYLHPHMDTAKCTAMSHSGRDQDAVWIVREWVQYEHKELSDQVALVRMPKWVATDRKLSWQKPVEPPAGMTWSHCVTAEQQSAYWLHDNWRYLKDAADRKNQKGVSYTRGQFAWASAGA